MKKTLFLASLISMQIASAQTWQKKYSGFVSQRGIIDIAAPDAFNAYGIAYDASNFNNSLNEITSTNNSGFSWKAQSINLLKDHRIMGIATAPGLLSPVVHLIAWNPTGNGGAGGKVVRSLNNATTWAQEGVNTFTDPASFPDDIAFLNANDGVMFGDPVQGYFEFYTTNNGGNKWVKVDTTKIPHQISTDSTTEFGAAFVMEKFNNTFLTVTYIVDSLGGPTGRGRLLESDDKGKSWYVKNANMPIIGFDITMKFRNKSVGLLKNAGTLYRTTDGGLTWNIVPYKGSWFNYDMDDVPGKPGWWVSTGGNTGLPGTGSGLGSSRSVDDGNTWTLIDTAVTHTCVEMVSYAHGYSGGITTGTNKDGVFVYTSLNPFKSAVDETVDNETIATGAQTNPFELNVFPNPSAESFNLSVNAPDEKFALIKVYNSLGGLVFSERIVPVGIINFGKELTAGVYTAEIIIGGNKNTIQIVKQ